MDYEELRKIEPKNVPHFKKTLAYIKEIERLNCVLSKGMVREEMFNKLVLKIDLLCKEMMELDKIMGKNLDGEKTKEWRKKFFAFCIEEQEKIQKRFKFRKCKWCDILFDIDEIICPDEDCESNYSYSE